MSTANTPVAGTFDLASPAARRPDVRGVDAPAWPAGFPHPTSVRRSPRARTGSSASGAPRRRVSPPRSGGGLTLVPSNELLDELMNEPSMETERAAVSSPLPEPVPEPLAQRRLPERGFGTIVPPEELADLELDRLVSALPAPIEAGPGHVTYEDDDLAWFDDDGTVPPALSRRETAERPGLMLDGDYTEELPAYLLNQKDDTVWIALTAAIIAAVVVATGTLAGTAFLMMSA